MGYWALMGALSQPKPENSIEIRKTMAFPVTNPLAWQENGFGQSW
ncbi:MAG: hypothetical protein R2941_10970 [Desulfobacterales bacterium]